MLLNFDATFANGTQVTPVKKRMSLVLRRMLLASLVMAMIANADARDVRVAREAENLEKMKPPQKHQKTLLSFDETFAKAVDVVVMTVLLNRRMSLVNHAMVTIVNDARVESLVVNHEKTKTLPQEHQKTIFNFDAPFGKADVVMTTQVKKRMSPVNRRMLLVNHVMIAKIAENAEIVVILMTLLMKQLLL